MILTAALSKSADHSRDRKSLDLLRHGVLQ